MCRTTYGAEAVSTQEEAAKAAPERRWTIYVCPECEKATFATPFQLDNGEIYCHHLSEPWNRPIKLIPVEVVEAQALEEAREALADTGMKLALMVDALAEQGRDPSELERELLNPIQRALGAHESSTSPRSGGGR